MTNDIAGLIAELRCKDLLVQLNACFDAADALEQLQSELDAAKHELVLAQIGQTIAQEKLDLGSKSRSQLINEAHNMKGQRDWLAKELGAARRDAERLDWINDHHIKLGPPGLGFEWSIPFKGLSYYGRTVRQAIDAAMATATPASSQEAASPASARSSDS